MCGCQHICCGVSSRCYRGVAYSMLGLPSLTDKVLLSGLLLFFSRSILVIVFVPELICEAPDTIVKDRRPKIG